MKPWGMVASVATVLAAGAVTHFVTRPEGNGDTDRKARQVAERIGYPRGTDGNAYARSALEGNTDQKYFGEYGCSGQSALQLYEVPPPK